MNSFGLSRWMDIDSICLVCLEWEDSKMSRGCLILDLSSYFCSCLLLVPVLVLATGTGTCAATGYWSPYLLTECVLLVSDYS
jgi:hypothetical protein